jgi:3-hydroxybutyrate dehydrogenase
MPKNQTATMSATSTRPLAGKGAVVTGSTSGIGLGIARALAAGGANVMLNGLGDAGEIERVRGQLETEFEVKAAYHAADMTKPGEIDSLIQDARKLFGTVDILVNNAGIQHTAAVEDFPPEQWDRIIAINLSSSFHTIRAAVPHMKANGFGRIINIASVHGLVGSVHKAAYVAAKHGVVGLTKVVALETAEDNITCNSICPGWVLTPLVEAQIVNLAKSKNVDEKEATVDLLSEKQPSKQFVEVEQLGALVVFLSSEAAAQITGASLPVDGGWVAR